MAPQKKIDALAIGERIRAARNAKGLTQDQVGERLDISKSAVSQWENGQAFPDFRKFVLMCQLLEASADYIIFGESELLTAAEKRIVDLFRSENRVVQQRRGDYRIDKK